MGNYRTYSIRTHLLAPYQPFASASTLGATPSNDASDDSFHEPYVPKRRVLVPSTSVQSRTAARLPQLANHHALWHQSARAPSVRVHAAQHSVPRVAIDPTRRHLVVLAATTSPLLSSRRSSSIISREMVSRDASNDRASSDTIHASTCAASMVCLAYLCVFTKLCRSRQQARIRSSQ